MYNKEIILLFAEGLWRRVGSSSARYGRREGRNHLWQRGAGATAESSQ